MRIPLDEYCFANGKEELLAQWSSEENLPTAPDTISFGSKKKVWWQCEKGHKWESSVCSRTGRNTGCPVCAGKPPRICD